ncbi:glycosyltransferase family A protein [Cronobacter sakazakii]|nr:glycosyltransferase family A protein [Cronobacter sakazakii]
MKRWQRKYPKNITYICQENAGQSAARNNGLQQVATEWVTFIDPDDFVDADYFYNLDNFLYQNQDKDIKMVGCNTIMFYEAKNQYKDAHPLGFKFKKRESTCAAWQYGKGNPAVSQHCLFFEQI